MVAGLDFVKSLYCTLSFVCVMSSRNQQHPMNSNVSTESGWCLFKTVQDIWKEMKSVLWSQNRHSNLFSSLYIAGLAPELFFVLR